MDLDAFEAAGLYDPAAPNAEERRELIEHWIDRGLPFDEIVKLAGSVPVTLIARGVINPGPPLMSLRAVAEQAGVDLELATQVRRALGYNESVDDIATPQTAVEVLQVVALGCEFFGQDRTLALCRVIGTHVLAIVEAIRATFAASVADTNATELEVSVANDVAMAAWSATTDAVRLMLFERMNRDEAFVSALLDADLRVAIAFIDLVDSVQWSASLDREIHARSLGRFELRAHDLAVANSGRVVKFIGDEVMMVLPTVDAACRASTELCAFAEADIDLPDARGAAGFGAVTARDGDYFGPLVDLVSRASKIAEPGAVVVVDAIPPDGPWKTRSLGPTVVRGRAEPINLTEIRSTDY